MRMFPGGSEAGVGSPVRMSAAERRAGQRRGCALPSPGSGRVPGTGTCRGCGNRAASEPMTCIVCRGRVSSADGECRLPGSGRSWGRGGVLCRGRRGRVVSCRYCGVSDGFDGCGGLQKGLCRRSGDSFRLGHRTDSVPAVRAQKKGDRVYLPVSGPLWLG